MPESRGRKKAAPRKKPAPRKRVMPTEVEQDTPEQTEAQRRAEQRRKARDIYREIPEDQRYKVVTLPEPATRDQLLVAIARLDPLAQEVMLAARLAAFPNPAESGPPVNIHRKVRPIWAHELRKLGVFCIPELATHELVAPDASGMLINHTGATLQSIDRSDLWEKAKAQNPGLGKLVDNAKTPAQKRAAMRKLASTLPVETRIAMEKLIASNPEDLEPE
jgi:hypothetical protein